MKTLCKKAGVKYFRYHALRHFGASLLEQANVPIGSIQRILGHETGQQQRCIFIQLESPKDRQWMFWMIASENFLTQSLTQL
ncbi:MAG: tyrosine-type recombinase/integrase [Desulfobacterales bacterium]|jgi:integrase